MAYHVDRSSPEAAALGQVPPEPRIAHGAVFGVVEADDSCVPLLRGALEAASMVFRDAAPSSRLDLRPAREVRQTDEIVYKVASDACFLGRSVVASSCGLLRPITPLRSSLSNAISGFLLNRSQSGSRVSRSAWMNPSRLPPVYVRRQRKARLALLSAHPHRGEVGAFHRRPPLEARHHAAPAVWMVGVAGACALGAVREARRRDHVLE